MSFLVKLSVKWREIERGEVAEVTEATGHALIENNMADLYIKPKIKKVRKQIKVAQNKMVKSAKNKSKRNK